ncbi:MAG: hypothetical protein J6R22_00985 [Alphaproteobacteria bacterium]|nr:hypothetical protein [Alphaproteobacteria bacterium]
MSQVLSHDACATAPSRLFIFAGYSCNGALGACLLYYLRRLSELGDIVFVMDSDAPSSELEKLSNIPNIIYAHATRHGEYDFGSYKRGYAWARDNNRLKNYDWLYLVNDSVCGPLSDLGPMLDKLESSGADITGPVGNSDNIIPFHIQSWFVGLARGAFCAPWFDTFLGGVVAHADKQDIVLHYEVSLTQTALRNGASAYAVLPDAGRAMYSDIFNALRAGVPFVKCAALSNNPPNPRYLMPYTSDKQIIEEIYSQLRALGISWPSGDIRFDYSRSFRLTLFGIPLLTIYRKTLHRQTDYKFCIFDRIAICKISYTKKD